MKIAIVGFSGSGKSTLAKELAELYGCACLHLDTVQWLPGWVSRDREEQKQIVSSFLDGNDAWVIDGNYKRLSWDRRMQEADLIVELLFGRFTCYRRAWKRYFRYRGTSRPDMGEGCNEKIDWEFTKWIFKDGRTKEVRDLYASVVNAYPDKTVCLKNQKQMTAFLETRKSELIK